MEIEDKENIGEKIRSIRKNMKISQGDFADTLGVTQSYISKIESGLTTPNVSFLKSFREKFGADINTIICP